jgi:hypothetical protein
MTPPMLQALGVTPEGAPTRWNATGDVEGVGWLAAWGASFTIAMAALQALAVQREVPPPIHARGEAHV